MKRIVLLMLAFLLSGCLGVQNVKYTYNSPELDDSNSGIILGSAYDGSGLTFINIATREEIKYIAADVYCIRLPDGMYALHLIGGRRYPFGSNDPFVFEVKAGETKYVGSMAKMWRYPAGYFRNYKYKVKGYQFDFRWTESGPLKLSGDPFEIGIVDDLNDVKGRYSKDCPGLDFSDIKIGVME